jgi:hypothetical protein
VAHPRPQFRGGVHHAGTARFARRARRFRAGTARRARRLHTGIAARMAENNATIRRVCIEPAGDDVLIRVKVVPGASRDSISGVLGDRLKVRVSAPPEAGRASRAVCDLIAAALSVKPGSVSIERGRTSREKLVRVRAITPALAAAALGLPPPHS